MSVNFTWRAIRPENTRHLGAGTSSDIPVLEETFGRFPITFTQEHIPTLRAMHRASLHPTQRADKTIYSEIADRLESSESNIEVTTEW